MWLLLMVLAFPSVQMLLSLTGMGPTESPNTGLCVRGSSVICAGVVGVV